MDSETEEETFTFETDHLALRGNRDYANVLRTIAILEAQSVRVHKHLEELQIAKQRYLEQPELILQKLRNNEEIIAPNYISIVELPDVSNFEIIPAEEGVKIKEEPGTRVDQTTVRGKVSDDCKPETFNKFWSCEEQRRLEELLIKYPPEEIQSHRFAKIAKALGNRTPQQVSSRVQKYFQKLHDAGMPIPGRKPKTRRMGQPKTKYFYRPTTFFPAHNVSVTMPEDDEFLFGDISSPAPDAASVVSNDTMECDNLEFKEPDVKARMLKILTLIMEEKKEQELSEDCKPPSTVTAKCELCQQAPVSRLNWFCNSCYSHFNLCSDCLVTQVVSHKFEHIKHEITVEKDFQTISV